MVSRNEEPRIQTESESRSKYVKKQNNQMQRRKKKSKYNDPAVSEIKMQGF